MPAFTIGQNQSLNDHLNWCKEMLAENERNIELFEKGDMRIGAKDGSGEHDMTSQWVARLKKNNEALRRIIEALKPAEFQREVRS